MKKTLFLVLLLLLGLALFSVNALAVECSDGLDNDNDTLIDFPNDTGCINSTGSSEYRLPVVNAGSDQNVLDSDASGSETVTLNGSGSFNTDNGFPITNFTWRRTASGQFVILGTQEVIITDLPVGFYNISLIIGDFRSPAFANIDSLFVNVTSPQCSDGIDNDGDTRIDFGSLSSNDNGCSSATDNSELEACRDGLDNDGDSLIDYPADTSCQYPADTSEIKSCEDGLDNDNDGFIDFPDDNGCSSTIDNYENIVPVANAGLDQTVLDANADGSETVTLNGSGSFDPDNGQTVTDYIWKEVDSNGAILSLLGMGQTLIVNFAVGVHYVNLTVNDSSGLPAQGSQGLATDQVVINITSPQCSDGVDNDVDGTTDIGPFGVGDVVCRDAGNTSAGNASHDSENFLCRDSDSGLDFLTGGNTYGYTYNNFFQVNDTCLDQFTLFERSCTTATFGSTTVQIPMNTTFDCRTLNTNSTSYLCQPTTTAFNPSAYCGLTQCSDGVDNDNDTLVDFPLDAGCSSYDDDNENAFPVANAGSDQTILDANADGQEQVTLDGSLSTDDGTIVNYTWIENTPSEVTLGNGQLLNFNFSVGVHNVTLRVTDNSGLVDDDEVIITITASECNDGLDNDNDGLIDLVDTGCTNSADNSENSVPVANAGQDQTVLDSDANGFEEVTLNGSGSSDDQALNFTWTENPIHGTTETVTTNLSVGVHNITLTVTDTFGLTASDEVIVTVTAPQCSDTTDNDNDTLIDFPLDPGCTNTADNDENDTAISPPSNPPGGGGGGGGSGRGRGRGISQNVNLGDNGRVAQFANPGDSFNFNFNNQQYTLTINRITNEGVTVTVNPLGITQLIAEGSELSLDLNNDGVNDFELENQRNNFRNAELVLALNTQPEEIEAVELINPSPRETNNLEEIANEQTTPQTGLGAITGAATAETFTGTVWRIVVTPINFVGETFTNIWNWLFG